MSRKPRPTPPPKTAPKGEVKDAAKTLGSAAGTLVKETGRTAYVIGKEHKWIPALAGGYYLGAKGGVQSRAQNRHPYGGFYG